MSEYWKSTPKYWCKHCKTYVRDTKIERTQHEATAKHQGNLKRFLRDLHRGHEREEREKDRAKQEVERLNGVVSGDATNNASGPPWKRREATQQLYPTQRQATAEERMKQMAQLAEMGVSIPQEFRGNMAMAGEWQTVSERVISSDGVEGKDTKEDIRTSGRKKRKFPGEDDEGVEEEHGGSVRRKDWGSTTKNYPGLRAEEDDDLESLLQRSKPAQQTNRVMEQPADNAQRGVSAESTSPTSKLRPPNQEEDIPTLKTEPSNGENRDPLRFPDVADVKDIGVKQEPDSMSGDVLFKKRKAKNIRQK